MFFMVSVSISTGMAMMSLRLFRVTLVSHLVKEKLTACHPSFPRLPVFCVFIRSGSI